MRLLSLEKVSKVNLDEIPVRLLYGPIKTLRYSDHFLVMWFVENRRFNTYRAGLAILYPPEQTFEVFLPSIFHVSDVRDYHYM